MTEGPDVKIQVVLRVVSSNLYRMSIYARERRHS
jgi:hypothetical protein